MFQLQLQASRHLRGTTADSLVMTILALRGVLLGDLDRSRSVSLVPGGVDIVLKVAKGWKKLRLAHVSSH